MLELLQALQTRLTTELVAGTVGHVYLGISGNERQALESDYDILIIDAAGEDPDDAENTSSTEAVIKHVRYELLVRAYETEETLTRTLTKWETLMDVVWDPDYRRIENPPGTILAETIQRFFSVDDNLVGGDDFPLWRQRAATIDYRVAVERLGYHPF